MRLTSKVLPVMSVVTLSFVMFFVKRTPFCLEIELIKISIFLHKVNYPSLYVSLRMRKRAVLSILTVSQLLWELSTKFGLVLFNVIKSFDSVV